MRYGFTCCRLYLMRAHYALIRGAADAARQPLYTSEKTPIGFAVSLRSRLYAIFNTPPARYTPDSTLYVNILQPPPRRLGNTAPSAQRVFACLYAIFSCR